MCRWGDGDGLACCVGHHDGATAAQRGSQFAPNTPRQEEMACMGVMTGTGVKNRICIAALGGPEAN